MRGVSQVAGLDGEGRAGDAPVGEVGAEARAAARLDHLGQVRPAGHLEEGHAGALEVAPVPLNLGPVALLLEAVEPEPEGDKLDPSLSKSLSLTVSITFSTFIVETYGGNRDRSSLSGNLRFRNNTVPASDTVTMIMYQLR